jgi:hypothetical protein
MAAGHPSYHHRKGYWALSAKTNDTCGSSRNCLLFVLFGTDLTAPKKVVLLERGWIEGETKQKNELTFENDFASYFD